MLGSSENGGPSPGSGERGRFRLKSKAPNGFMGNAELAAEDREFSSSFPALTEWLTLQLHEGASIRTATLLIFCEEGKWKACIADRERDASFFRSADTFNGLLGALEDALREGTAEWRARARSGKR
jgi:hypothetical protein